MSRHRIRHLPVVDGERVIGVLSNRDVLEEVIAEEEKRINALETLYDMQATREQMLAMQKVAKETADSVRERKPVRIISRACGLPYATRRRCIHRRYARRH